VQAALQQDEALRRGTYTFGGFLSASLPMSDLPQADLEKLIMEAYDEVD
jgi:hypothetical protein